MKKHNGSEPKRALASRLAEPPEEGLSVDPDQLGPSFLRYATEQGNFETARAEPRELAPGVEPLSDDAPRDSATPAGTLWERTVERVMAGRDPVDPEALEAAPSQADPARKA